MTLDFKLISINEYSFSIYWKGKTYSSSINSNTSDTEKLKHQTITKYIIPKVKANLPFTEEDEEFLYLITDFYNWLFTASYDSIKIIDGNFYFRNKLINEPRGFYEGCIEVCYNKYATVFEMLDKKLNIKTEFTIIDLI